MGNAKVHHAVEASGFHIVADESCNGSRYYRDLVDESPPDLESLIDAIADRYFRIDCSCFSPNTERVENILRIVEDYAIDGVVHNVLLFCHGYNVEAKVIEDALGRQGIISRKVVTDYSFEDLEQLKVRAESFHEMLSERARV